MLPKKFRLLKTELSNFKKQKRIENALFTLFVSRPKATEQATSKFAFLVPLKIDKRSTVRHRIKRLLIEAVRPFLPQIGKGFRIVFLAKKTLIGKELLEIKKEVEISFQIL